MGTARPTDTRVALGVLALGVGLWAGLASSARAQPARALLVPHGLEPPAQAALVEVLSASLEMEVITTEGLTEPLRVSAGRLGPDRSARRRDAALERARTAYVQLQLGPAREAYGEALTASLASRRAAAAPGDVARIFFERALVALAAQEPDGAAADFVSAATIDPELAPDRDTYGEPVIRAFDRARARAGRGRMRTLRIERAPDDVAVLVDGRAVGDEATVRVRGEGPHLLTATRPGYVARSQLVRAESPEADVAIVLAPAEGPLLARDALVIWTDREQRLAPRGAEVVARAAGVTRIVEATGAEDGIVELVLHAPGSAEPLRSARGARRSWEPRPFHVLAEALAGRVVNAPPVEPDRAPVSLAVSAPSRVPPGEEFALALTIRDPDARLRRIRGECGDGRVERALHASAGTRDVRLEMSAPEEESELPCLVVGQDVMGETIVRFPSPDESLLVQIRPEGGDEGLAIGLTIAAIVLAAAGAVVGWIVWEANRPNIFEFDLVEPDIAE